MLIDRSLRLFFQISDFGLAKLVGETNEGEIAATKVVNAYGYLAPEYVYLYKIIPLIRKEGENEWFFLITFCRYLSNGLATTKSDVYAFGVVLFEIISGKEAIIQTQGPEKRSLASIVSSAYKTWLSKNDHWHQLKCN